jgi:hypothetical protein
MIGKQNEKQRQQEINSKDKNWTSNSQEEDSENLSTGF